MKYLVDSDWIINGLAKIPFAVHTLTALEATGLAISSVTVAEVLEGAYRRHDPARALATYREYLGAFAVLPVTTAIAEQFARIRALLRSQGNRIPDIDIFIAATALEHDITLLTRNLRHFERVPGLKLYHA